MYPKSRLLLTFAVVLASVLVVVLSSQLRGLRITYHELLLQSETLQPGMFVPPMEGTLLDGSVRRLGEGNDADFRQVYFVYNTSCQFCLESIPAWQQIASLYGEDPSIDIVGLSLDGQDSTRAYAAAHNLPYNSVTLDDPRYIALHRFYTVPQTIVIDRHGTVLHSQRGVLRTGIAFDSITAILD